MKTLLFLVVAWLAYRWWINNTTAGADFGDKVWRAFNPDPKSGVVKFASSVDVLLGTSGKA